jgi:hypothetical protein
MEGNLALQEVMQEIALAGLQAESVHHGRQDEPP